MYNQTPPPFSDPGQSPDSKHQKVNTIWKIFVLIYVLAEVGLSIYWMFDESGLVLMLHEWQAALFNGYYYTKISFLVCILLLLVPVFVIKRIVEKVTGVKIERGKV